MDRKVMTWYSDLHPCDYFGAELASRFKAVGWLERGESYATGDVPGAFFAKLCRLIQNPWNFVHCAGFHSCSLCRFTGGSGAGRYGDLRVPGTSTASVFVPGDGFLYVSPVSIAHYIDAHEYQPPAEYCAAVLACPEMRSMAYLKAILANGGRGLVSLPEPNKGLDRSADS